jgi:diguanylate cyclase (GGDEF)-like protein
MAADSPSNPLSATASIRQRWTVQILAAAVVSIFALGMVAVALAYGATLRRVKVNGPIDQELSENAELLADVLPPPLFLVEADRYAYRMVAPGVARPTNSEMNARLRRYEDGFAERRRVWERKIDDPELLKVFSVGAIEPGERYLRAYPRLIELVGRNQVAEAQRYLNLELRPIYLVHRSGIERLVTELRDRETLARDRARSEVNVAQNRLLVIVSLTLVITVGLAGLAARRIVGRLRSLQRFALQVANGDLAARSTLRGSDEMTALGAIMNELASNLDQTMARLRLDTERSAFGLEVANAFDNVDSEAEAIDLAAEALAVAVDQPAEVLIAEEGATHLRVATTHPTHGGPGCGVESTAKCIAVRRGSLMVFDSSDQLTACPHLKHRAAGPCSAVCAPVTFLGRSIGVIHSSAPLGTPVSKEASERIGLVATQAGARIGIVRTLSAAQHEAATDALTGLANRRDLENRMHRWWASETPFVFVMVDLDRFKLLNDTYGHETGDRALQTFAATATNALRPTDFVARWGGEEFAIVLTGTTLELAATVLHRLRTELTIATIDGGLPQFTASYGAASSGDASTLDELVRSADRALYQAKEEGRDRVVTTTQMWSTDEDLSSIFALPDDEH